MMTPVGNVPENLLTKIQSLAGFRFDEKKEPVLLSDLVRAKRINPSSERKSNEKNLIDSDLFLPIRYYNFIFAQTLTKTLEQTIEFTENNLYKNWKPVFLPELLGDKNPFLVEYISYTKIMNLCSNANKDNYSRGLLKDYWKGGQGSKHEDHKLAF